MQAGETAAVFQGSTLLPALGSILAFGVGTEIGKELCGIIGIEGCWSVSSLFADPTETVEGKWEFLTGTPTGWEGETPYAWYWKRGSQYRFTWTGLGGVSEKCGVDPPTNFSKFIGEATITSCKGETAKNGVLYRSAMENRKVDWHATDTAQENYAHTPNSKWSELLAKLLKEKADETPEGRVGRKIASEIDPKVKDPYATYVTVPSCSGEAWIECKADLEALKLVPERSTLDWKHALIELEPGAVTKLAPSPGTEVKTETKVVVTTNPDEAGMPLVVPEPKPGETYADYIARLAPGLDPHRVNVCEACINPKVGPNGVVTVDPEGGTRVDPEIGGEVEVRTNPPDAPPAAGTWSPPAMPSLDLDPLTEVEIGCNDFPFGVFCWIADGLTSWGSEGECPSFAVPFVSDIRDAEDDLVFDTCTFEPAMSVIRPVIVILSFFGVAWLLASSAMGLAGGASADD